MRRLFLLALMCAVPLLALGEEPPAAQRAQTTAADPAAEARLQKLASELRCLVCQNETLAGSHADLAVDLKNQIREKIQAGQSDREIIEYLVARYGDFVLYRPPLKATTVALWVGPFLLLGFGLIVMLRRMRKHGAAAREASAPVAADLAHAERLLQADASPAHTTQARR